MKAPFFSQTFEEFCHWSSQRGQGLKPLKRLVVSIIKKGEFPNFDSEFSSSFLESLSESFSLPKLALLKKANSVDGTRKFLFGLEDGNTIESVALNFNKRYTLCLSSQAGCGMACKFCFTGEMGLKRNLKAHEIVGQYLFLWQELNRNGEHPQTPNIVFMGQGEPLHNFEELKKAIEILCFTPGLALGPKQITISTVGFLPGLDRLNELPPINLALSLHSPFEKEREELIPMSKAYPITAIFASLKRFSWHHRKRINFEYLLLAGVNDSRAHAQELAKLIEAFPNLVNIIPFNPYPGARFKKPSLEKVEAFKKVLVQNKVKVMVRQTKGDDVLAACGQLASTV